LQTQRYSPPRQRGGAPDLRANCRECKEARMKRLFQLIVGALAVVGGWYAVQQANEHGLTNISLPGLTNAGNAQPPSRGNETIRLATFNIQVFGESKLNDAEAMRTIVAILKNFDLIAIQEVRSVSQDILPQLISLLNADGHHYDYALGPRLGRSS